MRAYYRAESADRRRICAFRRLHNLCGCNDTRTYTGAIVGAIGHSLADFISGYPIFCIPTFIIKGIMGFAIGKIVYGHVDIKHFIIGGIVALVIVTGGYFVAEIPLMGYETALVSLISSPIQWCMSMVASAIIVRY